MPKVAKKLNASEIKAINDEGSHAVGGVSGLYLRVAGKSKCWVLNVACGKRLNRKGEIVTKRLNIGLGSIFEVSLQQAREKALTLKTQIKHGVNPIEEKRKRKRLEIIEVERRRTFRWAAEEFINLKQTEWVSEKHKKQWSSTLERYVYPHIGQLVIEQITVNDILRVLLQPSNIDSDETSTFWNTKTETATRVRGRIETILSWAIARGYRSNTNPASWGETLKYILPSPSKIRVQSNFDAMHYTELPTFFKRVYSRISEIKDGESVKYRAVLFTILTVGRTSEITGATKEELQGSLWVIPKHRMKTKKRSHAVPLSNEALKLLQNTEPGNYFFTTSKMKKLSDNSLLSVLRELGYTNETVHGFRSTFKDWVRTHRSTAYSDEVSELCLAHVNNDATRSAYARDQLIELRKMLLSEWSDFCHSAMQ